MIHVAAAIIVKDNKVLLAKRPDEKHQGGKWEFPGGKLDDNETPLQALIRECREEIAIEIDLTSCQLFDTVEFDYGDKQVVLHFYSVSVFTGEPAGQEGQQVRWFELADIERLEFPEANKGIVEKLLA